jgi:hypothetical protein
MSSIHRTIPRRHRGAVVAVAVDFDVLRAAVVAASNPLNTTLLFSSPTDYNLELEYARPGVFQLY